MEKQDPDPITGSSNSTLRMIESVLNFLLDVRSETVTYEAEGHPEFNPVVSIHVLNADLTLGHRLDEVASILRDLANQFNSGVTGRYHVLDAYRLACQNKINTEHHDRLQDIVEHLNEERSRLTTVTVQGNGFKLVAPDFGLDSSKEGKS